MKKTLISIGLITLLVIMGSAMVGCTGTDSPSNVVKKYYKAVNKGDTDAINKLMVPEAAALTLMLMEYMPEEIAGKKVKKTKQTIDGDNAVVNVTYADGTTNDYELVKVDEKWLITINK